MKTKTKILSLLIIATLLFCALTSCGANVASSGVATVVVESADGKLTSYRVDLYLLDKRDEGALSLLEYLSVQKTSDIYFTAQWGGGYGAYITSINSLSPDPLSEYIAVYTSEESDFSTSNDGIEMPVIKYGEKELKYSGVGISSMTVKDGTVIMFRLERFA